MLTNAKIIERMLKRTRDSLDFCADEQEAINCVLDFIDENAKEFEDYTEEWGDPYVEAILEHNEAWAKARVK